MQIKKVGILGCGLMGSGIAQVSAVAGYDVTVLEQEQKFLDKGFAGIEKSLAKMAEKPEKSGVTPEKARESRARINGTTSQQALADCDIIIEAIIENVEVKKKTFRCAGCDRKERSDLRQQHLFHLDHRSSCGYQPRGQVCRSAFFQSRAADETGRGRKDNRHQRRRF